MKNKETNDLKELDKSFLIDHNLTSIQNIISRLSIIGYTILNINILINCAIATIVFTVNVNFVYKISLLVILFFISLCFVLCSFKNFVNEKKFRNLYDFRCKNIDELITKSNYEILKIDIDIIGKPKKKNILKSFVTILYCINLIIPIFLIILVLALFL